MIKQVESYIGSNFPINYSEPIKMNAGDFGDIEFETETENEKFSRL